MQYDLQITNKELKKYKENEKSLRKENSELQKQSSMSKNKTMQVKQWNNSKHLDKKEEESEVTEEMTARHPIPS